MCWCFELSLTLMTFSIGQGKTKSQGTHCHAYLGLFLWARNWDLHQSLLFWFQSHKPLGKTLKLALFSWFNLPSWLPDDALSVQERNHICIISVTFTNQSNIPFSKIYHLVKITIFTHCWLINIRVSFNHDILSRTCHQFINKMCIQFVFFIWNPNLCWQGKVFSIWLTNILSVQ